MTPEEFAAARRALSTRLITTLVRMFLGLDTWRKRDADTFVAQAVPAAQGSQRALAALAAAYVADQAGEALGRTVAPPGVPDGEVLRLRGVPPQEVYRRPFATVYTALARGRSLTRALELGETRLAQIAEMDLQQTYARATRSALRRLPSGARPSRWRRVLQGEENCALCVIASTQRYRVEDLNPIHPGCDCRVEGLWGPDRGQVIEPELLEQVHGAVLALTGHADRGGRAPDYRHLVVQMTREHGELGPLLVRPGDRFTGPDDLAS